MPSHNGEYDSSDFDDDNEAPWAETPQSDFPPEEEDEDNPDWYRVPDPGEDLEEVPVYEVDLVPTNERWDDEDDWDDWGDDDPDDEPEVVPPPATPVPRGLTLKYDAEGYYAYVLAKQSPLPLEAGHAVHVQHALQTHGVKVVKHGRSFQPASDGIQYDWYFRVRSEDGAKPRSEIVERALSALSSEPLRQSPEQALEELRKALAAARADASGSTKQIQTLASELEAARAAARQARADAVDARQALLEQIARHQELETELIAKLSAAVSARRNHTVDPDVENLVEHLTGALQQQTAMADKARQDANVYLEHATVLDEENAALRKQLSQVPTAALADTVTRALPRPRSKRHWHSILAALLPTVSFHGGSLDVMFGELPDPLPVLEKIGKLALGQRVPNTAAMRGAPGWYRVHFLTGTDDSGRLYYKRAQSPDRIHLLVSRKGQQNRDAAYIRDLSVE